MQDVLDWLGDALQWVVDFLLWLPLFIFQQAMEAFVFIIESLPVPGWLQGADPFANLDPGVVYFVTGLEIPSGIGIVVGSYVTRFIIRRIPVIG